METMQKRRVRKVAERHSEPVTEKVETIFDYNPTELELRRWVRKENGHYKEMLALLKKAVTSAKKPDYYMIGLLFAMRGEEKRANEYFAKAPQWQQDLLIEDF